MGSRSVGRASLLRRSPLAVRHLRRGMLNWAQSPGDAQHEAPAPRALTPDSFASSGRSRAGTHLAAFWGMTGHRVWPARRLAAPTMVEA